MTAFLTTPDAIDRTLADAIEAARTLIVINPRQALTPQHMRRLRRMRRRREMLGYGR